MATSIDDQIFSGDCLPKTNVPSYNWVEVTQDFLGSCKGELKFILFGCNQIYVRAGLDRFGLTKPFTINLSRLLLSFFNFLLSLQLLAHWFFRFKPVKTGKITKVKD